MTLFATLCTEIDRDYAILSETARDRLKAMLERMARAAHDRARSEVLLDTQRRSPTRGLSRTDDGFRRERQENNVTVPMLLTVAEAAKASGISRSELYRRIAADKLRVKRVGSKWRVKAEDLHQMVDGLPTLGKESVR